MNTQGIKLENKKSLSSVIIKFITVFVILSVLITGISVISVSYFFTIKNIKVLENTYSLQYGNEIYSYIDDLYRKINYIGRINGFTDMDNKTQTSLLTAVKTQLKF